MGSEGINYRRRTIHFHLGSEFLAMLEKRTQRVGNLALIVDPSERVLQLAGTVKVVGKDEHARSHRVHAEAGIEGRTQKFRVVEPFREKTS